MDSIEDEVIGFFSKRDEVVFLSLFGSRANGKSRQESDVDIAVLFNPDRIPGPMEMIEMREDLSDRLRRDVDLVCLNTSSPIIGFQVLNKGKALLVKNRKLYDCYVINLLTDYCDLKRLRRPIEDSILKRRYYGRS
ncbi:MAG: nucleotidyltransferase domain-containing protein [Waddliaceae bacterium]